MLEAGPLGVEMLTALAHRGIETHLVDENAWLLSQVADPEIAEPVQESLEDARLHPPLRRRPDGLRRRAAGTLRAVDTSEGEIEADICVIATHKEPETTLARSIGLKLGSTGALVVDERMRDLDRRRLRGRRRASRCPRT